MIAVAIHILDSFPELLQLAGLSVGFPGIDSSTYSKFENSTSNSEVSVILEGVDHSAC